MSGSRSVRPHRAAAERGLTVGRGPHTSRAGSSGPARGRGGGPDPRAPPEHRLEETTSPSARDPAPSDPGRLQLPRRDQPELLRSNPSNPPITPTVFLPKRTNPSQ